MESREARRTRSLLAVAAGAVLFGTSGTARSLGSDGLDGLSVAAWRTVIGAIGLLAAARWRGERVLAHRWHPRPVAAAAVSVFGYQFAFFAAVDRIGVANATIVSLGTAPVAAGLLDRLMSKRPVHRRWAAGVALAVGGIVLLSGGGSGGSSPAGWLAAIAAGAAFPVYAASAQVLVRDRPPLTAMTTIFLAGSVPAVIALATSPPTGVEAEAIATVLYLGLAATALAYGLWSFGLGLPLRDSVTVTLLEPVSATILAVTLLDEHLGRADGIGVIAVLVGVVVATLPPRVRAPQ